MDSRSCSQRLWVPYILSDRSLDSVDRLLSFEPTKRGDGVPPLPRVEIEGGCAIAELDVLLLPSKASRRSVTPNPHVKRARLWSGILFICIRAGEILDHTSLVSGENDLPQSHSRSRPKKRPAPSATGEVRDVLSKLSISKPNGNLLKASFSARQR